MTDLNPVNPRLLSRDIIILSLLKNDSKIFVVLISGGGPFHAYP